MTSNSQTSLDAYHSISDVKLNQMQAAVYQYIQFNPGCTNEQISYGLKMRLQSVTPRTTELIKMGKVFVSGRSKQSSGRYAKTYEVVL